MSEQIPTELELLLGSDAPFQVLLYDESDEPEDLSLLSAATLTVVEELGGDSVFTRVLGTNMTRSENILECDALTSVEEGSLSDGMVLLADLLLTVDGDNFRTKRFYVKILAGITEAP